MDGAAYSRSKNIVQLKTDALIPYVSNARTHSDEQVAQIAASIKEFGFTNPVLVDGSNGIIAGHGRVLAARKLGMTEVPTIELGYLTDAQRRAYILADNKLAMNAGWDDDLLRVELVGLQSDDFDLALIGFSPDELEALSLDVTELEDLPYLPIGDGEPFQVMTFTLHDDQVESVQDAIKAAKAMGPFDSPNENSNGNALARIAETFNA